MSLTLVSVLTRRWLLTRLNARPGEEPGLGGSLSGLKPWLLSAPVTTGRLFKLSKPQSSHLQMGCMHTPQGCFEIPTNTNAPVSISRPSLLPPPFCPCPSRTVSAPAAGLVLALCTATHPACGRTSGSARPARVLSGATLLLPALGTLALPPRRQLCPPAPHARRPGTASPFGACLWGPEGGGPSGYARHWGVGPRLHQAPFASAMRLRAAHTPCRCTCPLLPTLRGIGKSAERGRIREHVKAANCDFSSKLCFTTQ